MQTTLWQALLGLFIAGYLALEGADFGAAMLLPVFGRRNQHGRDATVRAIAPLFLGNEVWLVAAIGVTEGAFPKLAGTLLSSLYPVFVLILVAWLTRDAGLWFRSRGNARWRWRWDCATALASAALPVGWGVVLANLALGVPTHIFGLIPILSGLLLAGFCALHGTLFLSRRLPTRPAIKIRDITRVLSLPVAAAVALTGLSVAISHPSGQHWPLWLLGAILFTAAISARPSSPRPTADQTRLRTDTGETQRVAVLITPDADLPSAIGPPARLRPSCSCRPSHSSCWPDSLTCQQETQQRLACWLRRCSPWRRS
jgi:cytochrome bd-type quinol oxidase subunit 2